MSFCTFSAFFLPRKLHPVKFIPCGSGATKRTLLLLMRSHHGRFTQGWRNSKWPHLQEPPCRSRKIHPTEQDELPFLLRKAMLKIEFIITIKKEDSNWRSQKSPTVYQEWSPNSGEPCRPVCWQREHRSWRSIIFPSFYLCSACRELNSGQGWDGICGESSWGPWITDTE